MIRAGFLLVALSLSMVFPLRSAETIDLFGHSAGAFHRQWQEQGFPLIAATEYDVTDRSGGVVVTGRAQDANRALGRRLGLETPTKLKLSWSWRVRSKLTADVDERTKAGDDFAARVFVVFETSMVPTRTRAINYLWSAREPVGAVFPSPYTKRVAHIVLRNADSSHDPAAWVAESRDVLADYRAFFGASPTVVTAVAIMVDSDNTDGYAEADFSDMVLEINPVVEDSG